MSWVRTVMMTSLSTYSQLIFGVWVFTLCTQLAEEDCKLIKADQEVTGFNCTCSRGTGENTLSRENSMLWEIMAGTWRSRDRQRSGCVSSPCSCWLLTILSHCTAFGCDDNRPRHCRTFQTCVHLQAELIQLGMTLATILWSSICAWWIDHDLPAPVTTNQWNLWENCARQENQLPTQTVALKHWQQEHYIRGGKKTLLSNQIWSYFLLCNLTGSTYKETTCAGEGWASREPQSKSKALENYFLWVGCCTAKGKGI